MQTSHDFFDRSVVVPPVNIEYIDVVSAQFLQGCVDRELKRFHVIAEVCNWTNDIILAVSMVVGVLDVYKIVRKLS